MTGDPTAPARWRVEVTTDCAGSGMCVASAPRYFHLVQGFAEPRHERVAPDDSVVAAAELCPMNAIQVLDAATGTEGRP